MKTSYYGNLRRIDPARYLPVRISLYAPRFSPRLDALPNLAPTKAMFSNGYDEGDYQEMVEGAAPRIEREVRKLKKAAGDRELVLLCYEKDPTDCHRRMFARWWEERTGEPVEEL